MTDNLPALPEAKEPDPLSIMRGNMLFWQRHADALAEQLRELVVNDAETQARANAIARDMVEARAMAQKCAADAAPFMHPRVNPVDAPQPRSSSFGKPVMLIFGNDPDPEPAEIAPKYRELTDDPNAATDPPPPPAASTAPPPPPTPPSSPPAPSAAAEEIPPPPIAEPPAAPRAAPPPSRYVATPPHPQKLDYSDFAGSVDMFAAGRPS